ncbi:class I SAM-dependent methyltransferase [Photorhabdus asymbiotica]|uniref:class I SAM-dependent methyltransferase n=1 Tax=Photorhabdus asymbiotica TaxID=291112 RepID=UPI003DA756A7
MNDKHLSEFLVEDSLQDKYAMDFGDEAFSERMLYEHLSQEHDFASRNRAEIGTQVEFIYNQYLNANSHVLDLACGPGLYLSKLAKYGVRSRGYDISPAAIRYAQKNASVLEEYVHCDLNQFECSEKFDLVLMLFGIANNIVDLKTLLKKVKNNLKPQGKILLEFMSVQFMKQLADDDGRWEYFPQGGLLSSKPHYKLCKRIWQNDEKVLIDRNMVIEMTGKSNIYEGYFKGYDIEDINCLLTELGFASARLVGQDLPRGELTSHFFFVESSLLV